MLKNILIIIFLFFVLVIAIKLGVQLIQKKNVSQSNVGQSIVHVRKPKPKVIGWIPFWDQQNAFESFTKNVKAFDFISVFWYRINSNGAITTYQDTVEDQSIIDFAHNNNVKVLAIVANMPDYTEEGTWDPNRVKRVISTKPTREKHIQDLMYLVENKNFDGIDIDYEALRRNQREDFSLFIEELADALHGKGKLLGVAIHPKTEEFKDDEDNGSHAQDLTRIAQAADQLYFMTYLEHGKHSQPGPSGSIGWMEQVMRYALDTVGIPREKAFMGIGLFGLKWHQNKDGSFYGEHDDLTFNQIYPIASENNSQIHWDDTVKSSHFEYKEEGGSHIIWFENQDSVSKRLELAKRLGIGGVAFWRLGGEDTKIWEVLK